MRKPEPTAQDMAAVRAYVADKAAGSVHPTETVGRALNAHPRLILACYRILEAEGLGRVILGKQGEKTRFVRGERPNAPRPPRLVPARDGKLPTPKKRAAPEEEVFAQYPIRNGEEIIEVRVMGMTDLTPLQFQEVADFFYTMRGWKARKAR